MFKFLVMSTVFAVSASAMAYDSAWYKSEYWSGEYPVGFQVYKKGIEVLGRKNLDEKETPSVKCILKRNKYASGKALPKAEYVEMTKIAAMTAKQDFTYKSQFYSEETQTTSEVSIDIKKGDTVEYLANYSEGSFRARHNGKEFDADQDLFVNMEADKDGNYFKTELQVDQWINLSCVNKVNVWLNLTDLQDTKIDGGWMDGVRSYFYNPYN